jgi:hypothetical protein
MNDNWNNIDDFIAVLQLMRDGKWDWYANTRCKYVELRVDMRDGGCIISDRESKRISPAQLAYQYSAEKVDEDGS